nr:ribonuclease H-like domain-containing protein [Tanacetum cinerariifolium]
MVQTHARNHAQRGHPQHYARMSHPNPHRHVVPISVLTRSKLVPLTAARPIITAVPHNNMIRPRLANTVGTKPHSPPRRTINHRPSPPASNFAPKVTTAKAPQVNAVKDSGCSRHMQWNMSYLTDFEEINGGYVAFGGNPKGGKSIDTECIVLSLDFKLPDENQVLLRVPRENYMYNVDLKNIVPSGVLTCLFARAILDESNLWHRRLGHINFKTMNKLVKVVTDDNSRFTWVFFLATMDETSPILKTFITGIKNQLSIKVKIIKSDNETEFKNQDLNQFCRMKRIKREFSVPRTPQQNGIAERKNRTLIEAARTMLADSLLPILFWAEAVNTACYVQNRVLVTKPHNKTPYELLLGRTPSIGFMRPFVCPVTIFNTLYPLGKFGRKANEGFLVGYSVSSKAFRVFNSRTRTIQETLHINFLENQPNVAGSGPTWLFDIDTLTKTMDYQPVTAGNQPNPSAGNTDDDDATFKVKEPEFKVKKHESAVHVSPSNSSKTKEHDDKTTREAKGKSLVELSTRFRKLNEEFKDFFDNNINEVNTTSYPVPAVGQISTNSTNTFSVAGPYNTAVSPTFGKSSYVDTSQYHDDPNMPDLEDITYSDDEEDVGAEADFSNLETNITISLIPTTRVHKDHPVTQIIGDLSLATQTKSMTMMVKDQGGLTQINNEDFYTCMLACFLSQEEPKREEGIDYEEVFVRVARIEAIRLFLAYASFMGFMMYQMDVKSAFLYGTIEEEVYVCQPPGFEDPDYPDKVYKAVKELYGLDQAPRA